MAAPGHIRQRGAKLHDPKVKFLEQDFVCNASVLVKKLWSWEGPGRIIRNSGGSCGGLYEILEGPRNIRQQGAKSWRVHVVDDHLRTATQEKS